MGVTFFIALAVLLRIISNPLGNVFQKTLAFNGNHPLIINFLTYLFLSIICVLIAFNVEWHQLPKQFWFYSVLGGIAGATGNGFLVKALEKGDLSVLGPINSFKSIVGIIGGIVLLSEIPNLWGILGIALIVYGSYFVLETTRERFTWSLLKKREIQFRAWAMILTAIEAVFIKKIILVSTTTIAFISWCWFGAIFSFILLILYKLDFKKQFSVLNYRNFKSYFFLILCIGTMQLTTNYVLENIEVGYALSLFQLSIILTVLFGQHFFKEQDIRKKLIGSAIMIAGSVVIILFKDY